MTADARNTILELLAARRPDKTICPSEAARAMASPESWRSSMPAIHAAVDHLLAEGLVELSWKGQPLAARTGPYRIRRSNS
jgi:hypothetical protein